MIDLLSEWMKRVENKSFMTNDWLYGSDMQLYVRKSTPRLLEGRLAGRERKAICLDLASFEVYKKGEGRFAEFLRQAHEMNPWDATYVECVHNIGLRGFLSKSGMHMQQGTEELPSYYLYTTEKLISWKSQSATTVE